jgi:TonB family protein
VVNNDFLDIELLEDYLDGKLDSKTMYQIERQAEEDPFVAQALAGLSESPRRSVQSLSLLQKQLYDRISKQQEQKKRSVYTWQRLSIGAAAAVMFISVSIIFVMRDRQNREQRAKLPGRKVEVTMAPAVPFPTVSMPVGGWERFEVYLLNHKKANRASRGRSVELSFNIDTNGVPDNIIIISSSTVKDLDEEAVRLIKEGPRWKVPRLSSDKVIYKIDY